MTPPKKNLGQYFTISEELQQFIFDKVQHKSEPLLEPSFGAGHLLKKFLESDPNYPIVCYEIDSTVKPTVSFNAAQTVVYGDFLQQSLPQTFRTIIGNPPYVKQKTGNLYLRFIETCYHALQEGGEMLMIVPSDFLKLTHASSLITTMTTHGSFTDFLFPHNEKLFEGASIDVVVFRYEKGVPCNKTRVNGEERFYQVHQGIVTFRDTENTGTILGDRFDVYVGLVSGRDAVYQVPFGNITLRTDQDRCPHFIFPETYPTPDPQINAHLQAHKEELIGRKIRTFSEANWYEWGAPRNLTTIRKNWGKPCIYVRTMTRQKIVAFEGTVEYFGGSLLCLIPKAPAPDVKKVVDFLNTPAFQKDYLYAGRFKIGQKQLLNAVLTL